MIKNYILFKFVLTVVFGLNYCYGKDIYVNDNFLTNDVFCSVVGNDLNSGLTSSLPKLSLSSALSIAVNGDIIYIDTGTYSGTNNRSLNINKEVQLIGAGEINTVFDNATNTQRWATISVNNVKISKLTITRYALNTDGIALEINNGTGIELNRVLIYGNVGGGGQGAVFITGNSTSVTIKNSSSPCNRVASANYGGGYKISGSTVIFDNCSINNNVVSSFNGGGIRVEGATSNVSITNCSFDDNSSQAGGGMCITGGTVNISGCCFKNNIAEGNSNIDGGGAIFIQPGATTNINISNCSFSGNSATNGSADGGAISIKNTSGVTCNTTFNTCSFENNSCNDKGEDFYFDLAFSPTYNITFKNNTFLTTYSGTQVNLYNVDFPAASIKFEGLSSPTGSGGNGDIVADGSGVSITKPEMTGIYTESSTSIPDNLPITRCIDRFDGTCGTVSATFACLTENIWNGSAWSKGTAPTTFEHVILNANYNTQTHGNINACQMTVKSGVTLDIVDSTNGTYVYVVNSIFNSGTINVKTKGNLVQVNHPLDLNNDPIITPNINFEKNTGNKIKWDYIYWSKPIVNNILPTYTSSFDLKYYWDPDYCVFGVDRSYLGWQPLISEPSIGTGFITRVKTSFGTTPTNITLNYSGLSNNGDYNANIKYYDGNNNAFRNFTLLGNPYPGAIKFEDFYNDNKDKIYGTVYLWSSNTPYPGMGEYVQADYASFNLTGGVGIPGATTQSPNSVIPNGYIASAQGFMIRPKVNGTITFKNKQRTKDIPSNNQFYKTANSTEQPEKDRFWLRITDNEGRYTETLLGYIPQSSKSFDEAYDGPINSLSKIKFYTLLDNEKLIIQSRGKFDLEDKVALNYTNELTNDFYTISLSNKEGLFTEEVAIILYDKLLDIKHDLSQSEYRFKHQNITDRFEIIYKKTKVATEILTDDIKIYSNNHDLFIKSNDPLESLEIYDIKGKLLLNNQFSKNQLEYQTTLGLSTYIYVIKVKTVTNKVKTTKILLQ